MKLVRIILAAMLLSLFALSSHAQIVEDEGDCYIIHVDQMEVNSDESLMDILMMCPEFLSNDGFNLTSEDYIICVDDLQLCNYSEPFLNNTKACDVSTVKVSKHDVVGNGCDGLEKEISITFRNSAARSKATLWGSTYGNAQAYSDLTYHSPSRKFTLSAMIDGSARFARNHFNHDNYYREATNDVRLAAKWALTDLDSLQIVLAQSFSDQRIHPGEPLSPIQTYQRDVYLIATYNRILNSRGASFNSELGAAYSNDREDNYTLRASQVYVLAEFDVPLIEDKLDLFAGSESNYTNTWQMEVQRQQILYSDFFLMLYSNLGPFKIAVGDRFRLMNFWQWGEKVSRDMWHTSRHTHGLLGSIGCDLGKGHHLEGSFSKRYFTPAVNDFVEYDEEEVVFFYNNDYIMPTAYTTELRHTYQRPGLVLMTTAENINFDYHSELPNSMQTIGTSLSWYNKLFRLTFGASYNHSHWDSTHDNFYKLKFKPSVNITDRTRLAATLLYNSSRFNQQTTPNTYLDVRLSHYITPRINVFANYHDIAGQRTGNRALILGTTIYLN